MKQGKDEELLLHHQQSWYGSCTPPEHSLAAAIMLTQAGAVPAPRLGNPLTL